MAVIVAVSSSRASIQTMLKCLPEISGSGLSPFACGTEVTLCFVFHERTIIVDVDRSAMLMASEARLTLSLEARSEDGSVRLSGRPKPGADEVCSVSERARLSTRSGRTR